MNELLRPLSIDECRDYIYETLAARGAHTSSWKPGAVVRTIIYALAIMAAAFSRLQVMLARSSFLDWSSEEWLTTVARQVFGVIRHQGTFAEGVIVASNSGGGIYHLDPGDLIVRSVNGREFRNTSSVTIGANAPSVSIPVRAVELGVDGGAAAGTMTLMTTPLAGVSVVNPAAITGTDPETDEQLRQRCRAMLGSLSPNGPRDAYIYVATTSTRPDGSEIGVTRVETIPDGYGNLDVLVASPSGPLDLPDLDIVTDRIKTLVEPIGVNAIVQNAQPLTIDVTYELWLRRSSMSDAQIEARVEESLRAWLAGIRIGGQKIPPSAQGYVYASAIEAAIAQALEGEQIVRIDVTLPSSDVIVAHDEAPSLGLVTATAIHQISEAL